jgi:high-affinity iron transporter
MLLNSAILILREVLEAAVLVSVLLALSRNLGQGGRWFVLSLPITAAGTVLFASTLDVITDSLDGAGQEVTNASLQFFVYLLTLYIIAIAARPPVPKALFTGLMASAAICAMIREGSEMYLYISSFASVAELRTPVFTGSAIGAGIGISVGVLLYSALGALSGRACYRVCILTLCPIGAGMVMQGTMLLEQVDWLPSGKAAWDSSFLVAEQSIPGELMYAVFGYESTPSNVQLLLYGAALVSMACAYLLAYKFRKFENAQP